jgi:hypothetical protein
MRSFSWITVVVVAVQAFAAAPARAQAQTADDKGITPTAVAITPFVSLGSLFSSRVGAAIAFPWTDRMSLEAEVGYRREELNALSAHLSVLHDLPRIGRVTPYLAAGIGLEEYGVFVKQPNGGLATLARTAIAVNAGGGVKAPVNDRWGVRTDARWFNGLGEQAGEHWRVFNGVTVKAGR